MTRVTLEIHLTGDPEAVARACGPGVAVSSETVLVTEPLDQDGLHGLLDRLSDLGIELREFRPSTAAAEVAVARDGRRG
ncbi:hypothetical protein [Georgenia sp. SUBG003]|uniref:hypothetical protein n=1 Tax=Georgenia sp. SUBG003 TaxID=1497974 RepID=UPI0004D43EE2|nr:hypothetical protein DA06_05850 [Georgenia sp. SUBG003]